MCLNTSGTYHRKHLGNCTHSNMEKSYLGVLENKTTIILKALTLAMIYAKFSIVVRPSNEYS